MPGDYTNPLTPIVLSKVRKLVDEGQFVEASIAANDLLGQLSEVCPFVCNFFAVIILFTAD